MKKLSITIAVAIFTLLAQAQEKDAFRIFKPFKLDLSLGYAIPSAKGIKSGAILAIEPKYAIIDQLAIGLRVEASATARAYKHSTDGEKKGPFSANGSFLATGDYYFSNETLRPFLGAGAGIYELARVEVVSFPVNTSVGAIKEEIKPGFLVRGGFETGHFRMGFEYNIIRKSSDNIKNDYLGIKIGGFFGGRRQ